MFAWLEIEIILRRKRAPTRWKMKMKWMEIEITAGSIYLLQNLAIAFNCAHSARQPCVNHRSIAAPLSHLPVKYAFHCKLWFFLSLRLCCSSSFIFCRASPHWVMANAKSEHSFEVDGKMCEFGETEKIKFISWRKQQKIHSLCALPPLNCVVCARSRAKKCQRFKLNEKICVRALRLECWCV